MRRAALIYNPIAGRGRWEGVLAGVLGACRREGLDLEPVPTGAAGEGTGLAGELARDGRVEAVFALGGDGTAREVAAGLLGSDTPLGIVPAGTANLMALALGLPRDPVAAAAMLCHAPARRFDAGLAGASAFLMMVSAGLDGRAVAVDRGLKNRLGKSAILLHGVREWWSYGYPEIEIVADGEPLPAATFLAVCNIPYFGGSYRIAPGARPDDRRFELVTFHGSGRAPTLAFILGVVCGGWHLRRGDVSVRSVEEVVFTVPREAGVQIDGDPIPPGERGATIPVRLAPEPLLVLAPPQAGAPARAGATPRPGPPPAPDARRP